MRESFGKRRGRHMTRDWSWTESTVWTSRMLTALEQKGGKWASPPPAVTTQ
jgi:hypothetical protein